MKIFKIFGLILVAAVILFVTHVPVLRYISAATSPSLEEYPPIATTIETENYELTLIYPGETYNFWFDKQDQLFVGFSLSTETSVDYVVTFDLHGNLVDTRESEQSEYKKYEDTNRYTPIERTPNLEFGDTYSLVDLDGLVALAHYQFEEFTWPYMFYFIPVIRLDWKGTAFFDVSVGEEVLKFSVPTDFKGAAAYLDAIIEAEIYAYRPDEAVTDVVFLQIDETYYLSGYDGDIHRNGLGFYVVRRK